MSDVTHTGLLPCPFCGGSDLKSGGDDKVVCVWCTTCEASGPNHYGKTEWNTRSPDPTLLRRIEVLEAALVQSRDAMTKIRACSIAGATEGYAKPEIWGDALYTSHGDVAAALKAIEAVLSVEAETGRGSRDVSGPEVLSKSGQELSEIGTDDARAPNGAGTGGLTSRELYPFAVCHECEWEGPREQLMSGTSPLDELCPRCTSEDTEWTSSLSPQDGSRTNG